MIYTTLTKKALNFAFRAHDGQYDRSGVPYIFHPYQVAQHAKDEISCAAALLHDVVEDTNTTLDDLIAEGFPPRVAELVDLLTRRENEAYFDYIRRLAKDPDAVKIKLADLAHNSDTSRLDSITEADLNRLEKYKKAKEILNTYRR
ncbi:MAG: bifunctional (p)ppGpp synthetase/guanosine-3',5'-bis(diphosphate) 3'-pyrophosphohydrolase [Oscillospiraceae bacterium]|nr:bifunctional (p)ppGpp synthetase/guanosine-3',5'-bis(diphosphate) 3'-pyrophosphohydrolase [Oscillospiraceae bacterium]